MSHDAKEFKRGIPIASMIDEFTNYYFRNMRLSGKIYKMKTILSDKVVYHLPIGNELIPMNDFIGKNISFRFENEIYCIECGKKTKKSFQGFCWNCFSTSPENAECILRPELCLAHEGKGRNPDWEKKHHLQEHIVYFAYAYEVKVGVTRFTQVPIRWIDQGASSAIPFAKVPYRYLAGVIELEMKKYFTDKTSWQKMLTSSSDGSEKLLSAKEKAKFLLPETLMKYFCDGDSLTTIQYPVLTYPKKVKNIDLEKHPVLSGKLCGIKGQYLIMEDGSVLNVRKHNGYLITIEW